MLLQEIKLLLITHNQLLVIIKFRGISKSSLSCSFEYHAPANYRNAKHFEHIVFKEKINKIDVPLLNL